MFVITMYFEGLKEDWFCQLGHPRKIKNLLTYLLTKIWTDIFGYKTKVLPIPKQVVYTLQLLGTSKGPVNDLSHIGRKPTCLWGLGPGLTQTGLYCTEQPQKMARGLKFSIYEIQGVLPIYVAKTKVLSGSAVLMIFAFVLICKKQFPHDAVHLIYCNNEGV